MPGKINTNQIEEISENEIAEAMKTLKKLQFKKGPRFTVDSKGNTTKNYKDGGLAMAIEKVKAKGMEGGGKAVPPKFKGFSKLPESVQQQMNPDLAEKFGMGGDVKGKKSGNICRGRGIARKGTGFTLR